MPTVLKVREKTGRHVGGQFDADVSILSIGQQPRHSGVRASAKQDHVG